MEEEVQLYIDDTREKMEKAISHLESELLKIRAGKANPHILDGIHVDYYGVNTPLNQVSNISTPDAKTIAIQPWEKAMIDPIEKAILQANIGITPINNGELIRLNIPPLQIHIYWMEFMLATIMESILLVTLNQVSNISTPDAKTIAIQSCRMSLPWEKNAMIDPIEKKLYYKPISESLPAPINNGELIRLRVNIPPLTEERRKELVKQVKSMGENTKVSIRTTRREGNDEIKNLQKEGLAEDMAKDAEEEIQQLTNTYSQKVDEIVDSKEKDIMTI